MYLFEDVYRPSHKDGQINPGYGLQILQSDNSSKQIPLNQFLTSQLSEEDKLKLLEVKSL